MSDLLAARSQMAMSLAFHILFAVAGMAMPLLMAAAELFWLRTKDPAYLELAKRWSKGTAILFAVGAVSGTVLSFELGLLWPTFMAFAGPIVGMPFSLEGFAFFLESIFLGLYLYGWRRLAPWVHWLCGVGVCVCGVASGVFVVTANAWMNTPTGFSVAADGTLTVDVWAAMFNPAAFSQSLHMVIAAFEAVGFAVLGIHAAGLLRRPDRALHDRAVRVTLPIAAVAALCQLVSGDLSAKTVAETQPVKLAAMEAHWDTSARAPLRVGGWPDEAGQTTCCSIQIPAMLSVLAFGDPDATVRGLKDFPPEDHPPIAPVHIAFQIMVGCGTFLAGLGVLGFVKRSRPRWLLRLYVLSAPLGLIALEAGWVVTEVGRQPWIVQGVMRTADAVTPMPGLWVPFMVFSLLYLFLGVVVIALLRRHVVGADADAA